MSSQLRPPGRLRHRRGSTTLLSCLAVLAFLASGFGMSGSAYADTADAAAPNLHPHVASVDLSAAATGYTYWAYFSWDDSTSSWAYATVGPNDKSVKPADGDVYGFRWALHVGSKGRQPRADGDFDAICGSAGSGPHVAFVVDYGTTEDAADGDTPPHAQGICADQREGFTVQQTLQSEVPVRTGDGGLLCGINGYPGSGCVDTFKNVEKQAPDEPVELALPGDSATEQSESSSAADNDADSDDDSSKLLTIGVPVIIVVALGVGALVLRRRRS
jgi:hypothetical protein